MEIKRITNLYIKLLFLMAIEKKTITDVPSHKYYALVIS